MSMLQAGDKNKGLGGGSSAIGQATVSPQQDSIASATLGNALGVPNAGAKVFGSSSDGEYETTVSLPETIGQETDEEEEEYKQRCMLYQFDLEINQWKQCGVGYVKLMRHKSSGRVRVVVRRYQGNKVCANHIITSGMELKAVGISDRAWAYYAIDFSEGESSLQKLAIKFQNSEIAQDFKTKFEECEADLAEGRMGGEFAKKPEVDIMTKFQLKEGDWDCDGCCCRNNASVTVCPACATPKPGSGPAKSASAAQFSFKPTSSSEYAFAQNAVDDFFAGWDCDGCLGRNDASMTVCSACGTRKSESGPVVPTAKLSTVSSGTLTSFGFKPSEGKMPKEGGWDCDGCCCRNDASMTLCLACHSRKLNKLKVKKGKWTCGGCFCLNEATMTVCPACGTPNHVTQPKAKPTDGTKFTFGAPIIQPKVHSPNPSSFYSTAKMFAIEKFHKRIIEEIAMLKEIQSSHSRILEQNQTLMERQNELLESNNALLKQIVEMNKPEKAQSKFRFKSGCYYVNTPSKTQPTPGNGVPFDPTTTTKLKPLATLGTIYTPSTESKSQPISETEFSFGIQATKPKSQPPSESVHTPATKPKSQPPSETVHTPAIKPKSQPPSETVHTPATKPKSQPPSETVHTPATKPKSQPPSETVHTPATKPKSQPPSETVHTPATKPKSQPPSETVHTPATKPKSLPTTETGFSFGTSSTKPKSLPTSETGFSFGTPATKPNSQPPFGTGFSPAFFFVANTKNDVTKESCTPVVLNVQSSEGSSSSEPKKDQEVTKTESVFSEFFKNTPTLRTMSSKLWKEDNLQADEENEDVLFCSRSKLRRFDKETKAWTNCGVGDVKILLNKETGQFRVTMYKECNHIITADMKLTCNSSTSVSMWQIINAANGKLKQKQLIIDFKRKTAVKFKKVYEDCQRRMQNGDVGATSSVRSFVSADTANKFHKVQPTSRTGLTLRTTGKKIKIKSGFSFFAYTKDDVTEESSTPVKSSEVSSSSESKNDNEVKKNEFTFSKTFEISQSPTTMSSANLLDENNMLIVKLCEEGELQTDEESEDILFCSYSKLHRFINMENKAWEDCGVVDVKILRNKETDSFRVITQRYFENKVCTVNHIITTDMKLRTNIWFKSAVCIWKVAKGEIKRKQFAIKFECEATAVKFKGVYEECQKMLQSGLDGDCGGTSSDRSAGSRDAEHNAERDINFAKLPEKVDLQTGEESEETLFCSRSKFYRFDTESKAWKDRGVGNVKILHHNEKRSFRVIMRREQVLKVCANHYITAEMKLTPNAQSKTSWVWQAMDAAEGEPKFEQLAIKFKHEETAVKFKGIFEECQKELQNGDATGSVEKDEDVVFVSEKLPSETLQAKAKSLKLPITFYNYLDAPPCKGCIGCHDEDVDSIDELIWGREDSTATEAAKDPISTSGCDIFEPAVEKLQKKDSISRGRLSSGDATTKYKSDVTVESSTPEVSDVQSSEVSSNSDLKKETEVRNTETALREILRDYPKPPTASSVTSSVSGDAEHNPEAERDIHFDSIAKLPEKVDLQTGEESEQTLFCSRSKLYRFDTDSTAWKDRGVGDVKILRNKETGRFRVIMRREQVLKVCANHYITTEMKLTPNAQPKTSWVWQAMDAAEGEPKFEQLAIKFKHEETAVKFKGVFEECQKKLQNCDGDATGGVEDGIEKGESTSYTQASPNYVGSDNTSSPSTSKGSTIGDGLVASPSDVPGAVTSTLTGASPDLIPKSKSSRDLHIGPSSTKGDLMSILKDSLYGMPGARDEGESSSETTTGTTSSDSYNMSDNEDGEDIDGVAW